MNYLLLFKGIVLMYCFVNVGEKGDVVVFFGFFGIGKIILFIDLKCCLIGDDEYGWDDDGVFNFEGGCYVKIIKLLKEVELEIYYVICCDVLLENVIVCEDGIVDFDDGFKIENICVFYLIYYIDNIVKFVFKVGYVIKVIFLMVDVFGVLLLVFCLIVNQMQYYFLLGFIVKLVGIECGVIELIFIFFVCFGVVFLMLYLMQYVEVLVKCMQVVGVQVYLVNIGWNGIGKCIFIKDMCVIIDVILNGFFDNVEIFCLLLFDLVILIELSGVDIYIFDLCNIYVLLE